MKLSKEHEAELNRYLSYGWNIVLSLSILNRRNGTDYTLDDTAIENNSSASRDEADKYK